MYMYIYKDIHGEQNPRRRCLWFSFEGLGHIYTYMYINCKHIRRCIYIKGHTWRATPTKALSRVWLLGVRSYIYIFVYIQKNTNT